MANILKADGFTRKRRKWIRVRQPVINCLDIQTKSDRTACCVNLGFHLTFLPTRSTTSIDLKSFDSNDCELRERLAWEGESAHWWFFDDFVLEARDLVDCYEKRGKDCFDMFSDFPSSYLEFEPEFVLSSSARSLFPGSTKIRRLLMMARIHDHFGNTEKAISFSEVGLENVGHAVSLKIAFKEFLQKYR